MTKRKHTRAIWILALIIGGCGGSQPPPAQEPQPQPHHDMVADEAPEDEVPVEPEVPASGPAQLTVVAKVGTDTVSAQVQVQDESGAVIAEGAAGSALNVQSGALTIVAKITDAAVMADTPTTRHEVEVTAGDSATEEVKFPSARVKFTVNINGKPDNKATVTLKRNGAAIATVTSGASEFVVITPGRYEAVVKARNAEITLTDVVIPEDATRNIPLNVTL